MEDESIAPNTYLQLISQYGHKVVPVHYMLQYCVLARLSVYTDWISCGAISVSSILRPILNATNYSMIALNYRCHKNIITNIQSIFSPVIPASTTALCAGLMRRRNGNQRPIVFLLIFIMLLLVAMNCGDVNYLYTRKVGTTTENVR